MRALVLLLCLAIPSNLLAQEIQTIPPGDDKIVPLRLNQPAPFDGQLFDTNTAIRWGFWLQQYKQRLKLDVDTVEKACAVKLDFKKTELDVRTAAAAQVQADLRVRLLESEKQRLAAEEEARNPSWHKTREFGYLMGVLLTGGAVVLGIWALEKK